MVGGYVLCIFFAKAALVFSEELAGRVKLDDGVAVAAVVGNFGFVSVCVGLVGCVWASVVQLNAELIGRFRTAHIFVMVAHCVADFVGHFRFSDSVGGADLNAFGVVYYVPCAYAQHMRHGYLIFGLC